MSRGLDGHAILKRHYEIIKYKYMAQVSIYSTPNCTYCKAAKEYFGENKVDFQEFNVAEDMARRQEMIERSGQMGVPVIMIDNNIIVGFNKGKLAELLGL